MAIQPIRTGPCLVTWNSISLGYSEDGAIVRLQPFWSDVHSDRYGGRQGPPADSQLLGAIATVDVDLTEFEQTEVDKLSSFEKAGTVGTLPVTGTFIRDGSEFAPLLLAGSLRNITFSVAFLRQNHELNASTRHQIYRCGWECWINNTTSRQLFGVAAP